MDPLLRSKHTLKGMSVVAEVHKHLKLAFSKGSLRTLCLPMTGDLLKWADSWALPRIPPSQEAAEFESLGKSWKTGFFSKLLSAAVGGALP